MQNLFDKMSKSLPINFCNFQLVYPSLCEKVKETILTKPGKTSIIELFYESENAFIIISEKDGFNLQFSWNILADNFGPWLSDNDLVVFLILKNEDASFKLNKIDGICSQEITDFVHKLINLYW